MKYTNKELVRECILTLGLSFSIDQLKMVLINKFEVRSLKYKSVARGYLTTTAKSLEMDNLVFFDENTMKITVNTDNLFVGDCVVEYKNKMEART